ncbi:MAG TPA: aminodeoxychorismate/anthranilate synthase component II [bacterium]|jgi:anthranilate synthase/aminodeoxychorismate synthase-like glutamine amidotransferase
MLVVIDNYDSFTYNLVHYLEMLGQTPRVFRNDGISVAQLLALNPDRIVISPGPGAPDGAGISCDVIRAFAGKIPVLGVCLGHQCIAEVFGAAVTRSVSPTHGKPSLIRHDGHGLFSGLPNPFEAMRYHSLIVPSESLPECLIATAWSADGIVMGLSHDSFAVTGVQFHPESILTPDGLSLLKNFLAIEGGRWE